VLGDLVAFLGTAQPERARAFYEGVLGLRFVSDDEFALVFDSGGTLLRIQKVDEVDPAARTALGWLVTDLEAAVDALEVSFERYDRLDQDARGIWTAPNGARIAWFKDPDGNILSLIEDA
jgi:catechol 2,3-dioxygenase-like lactoylglutathione lyase family enzyme